MDSFDLNQVDEVISPCCDEEIKTSEIGASLKCPLCKANLKQRIYLPFLEYLMENGHVENLDFFDLDLYSQDKESLDSEDEEFLEGCVSFPDLELTITRPNSIIGTFTNLQGERKSSTFVGVWAQAFQHECDHLNGITFDTL